MEAELKKKWVDALRSGKYPQGQRHLRTAGAEAKFCCLGVLCEVAPDIEFDAVETGYRLFGSGTLMTSYLFRDALEHYDMNVKVTDDYGEEYEFDTYLMNMNDGCDAFERPQSFDDIADYIESVEF
jgi:hypothetical protein